MRKSLTGARRWRRLSACGQSAEQAAQAGRGECAAEEEASLLLLQGRRDQGLGGDARQGRQHRRQGQGLSLRRALQGGARLRRGRAARPPRSAPTISQQRHRLRRAGRLVGRQRHHPEQRRVDTVKVTCGEERSPSSRSRPKASCRAERPRRLLQSGGARLTYAKREPTGRRRSARGAEAWTRPDAYIAGAWRASARLPPRPRREARTPARIAAAVAFDPSVPGADDVLGGFGGRHHDHRLSRQPAAQVAAGRRTGARLRGGARLVPGSAEGIAPLGVAPLASARMRLPWRRPSSLISPTRSSSSIFSALRCSPSPARCSRPKKRQTLVTFIFFAVVTGVGGGDAARPAHRRAGFLGRTPMRRLLICIGAALGVWLVNRAGSPARRCDGSTPPASPPMQPMVRPRRIGYGVAPVPAFAMGVLTACFGGIVRDVLAGEPSILMRPGTVCDRRSARCRAVRRTEPAWLDAALDRRGRRRDRRLRSARRWPSPAAGNCPPTRIEAARRLKRLLGAASGSICRVQLEVRRLPVGPKFAPASSCTLSFTR